MTADSRDTPDTEPIPSGVYYSPECGNFYGMNNHQGQGDEFYARWFARWTDFPIGKGMEPTSFGVMKPNSITPDTGSDQKCPKCGEEENWRNSLQLQFKCGSYFMEGKFVQNHDCKIAQLEQQVARLTRELADRDTTIRSVSTMLGWGNVPPLRSLELTIATWKRELDAAESENAHLHAMLLESVHRSELAIGDSGFMGLE